MAITITGARTLTSTSGAASSTITHGQQLTLAAVGPWALQGVSKGSETLSLLSVGADNKISTYPGNARPAWVPGTAYTYNNNPTNYGGIVPAGGLVIDGYLVPAGTWVVQFRNFDNQIIIEGDCGGVGSAFPGVMFRGCRMRGRWGAPGWFNQNAQSNGGIIWVSYCDAGGVSTANIEYCESIFESKAINPTRDKFYLIRNYLSNATTLAFLRNHGDAAIENFCDTVINYGDASKHLNGIANGGGENATMWLRNNMVLAPFAGVEINDVVQMAADGGAYLGTGTNLDGSTGYTIKDNYLGGANFTLQLGFDKANLVTDVRNVHVTGNLFTTSVHPSSGAAGLSYKNPDFTQYGNTWSGNTWADGPNAGVTIPAPTAG